jgi:hypothetical protein
LIVDRTFLRFPVTAIAPRLCFPTDVLLLMRCCARRLGCLSRFVSSGNISVDPTDIPLTHGGEDISAVMGRKEDLELLMKATKGSFTVEVLHQVHGFFLGLVVRLPSHCFLASVIPCFFAPLHSLTHQTLLLGRHCDKSQTPTLASRTIYSVVCTTRLPWLLRGNVDVTFECPRPLCSSLELSTSTCITNQLIGQSEIPSAAFECPARFANGSQFYS